jgi:hypothetical protein
MARRTRLGRLFGSRSEDDAAVEDEPAAETETETEDVVEPEHIEAVTRPPAPEPEPEPDPRPGPEPKPEPEPPPPEPREWNVWEIEEALRARGEEQGEEVSYLLVYLREFASPDGSLPLDFDALVRESFGDLLEPEPEGVT